MAESQGHCAKPQNPETCSPEQVQVCHGDAKTHDCESAGCQRDPEGCSAEQIRECHGEVAQHPCAKV